MDEIDLHLVQIDRQRIQRAKEISDIKSQFSVQTTTDRYSIRAKAVIVLCYAHWEGFYNECVESYAEMLRVGNYRVRDVEWMMLVGTMGPIFQRLQDRGHSSSARCEFVGQLKQKIECTAKDFDSTVIKSRSNLNFARLKENFTVLGFDISPFERRRIRLDKELVGWRHSVAHGSSPDLSTADIADHLDFTETLLLLLSDRFQFEMLQRHDVLSAG